MQNLIQFLIKYGHVLTFLLLELFCFSLIVQNNQNQQEIFLYSKGLFFGKIKQNVQEFKDFLSIKEYADSLARENANLRAEFRNAKLNELIKDIHINDSLWKQMYTYLPATVVANSISLKNNTMLIDKGSQAGIQKGMGVLGQHGVVGVVTKTTEHFAQVMPIINQHSRTSVALKRNNYFGTLRWKGPDIRTFVIEDMPKRFGAPDDIMIGDTVITSGYSTIFPKGLAVGTVSKFKSLKAGSFYDIRVKSFTDISTLKTVYVVKNLYRQELDSLKTQN